MTNLTIQDRVNQSNKEYQLAYTEFCKDLDRNPKLNWEDYDEVSDHIGEPDYELF